LDPLRTRQRCLLIADDLTGAADAGVQFAKRGLKTLLKPFRRQDTASPAGGQAQDVLVINTATRGLPPKEASDILSGLLKGYDAERFPVLYKKIDSTLRGNIGSEIDAVLKATGLPFCFMAPSYPEQDRVLVDGIMRVKGKSLALTETARDATSPVQEYRVLKLLADQTPLSVGAVGLGDVVSGKENLRAAVERKREAGDRILLFDAATRPDLGAIADVAFALKTVPLLVGSAGLAGEVARILAPGKAGIGRKMRRPFRHILIVAGSASAVTHTQLGRLQEKGFSSFELPKRLVSGSGKGRTEDRRALIRSLQDALAGGGVIFRSFSERWIGSDKTAPLSRRIIDVMADVAFEVLREGWVGAGEPALILTGGDTALAVLQLLDYEWIELEEELLEGIVRGALRGGPWDGLAVVTKAGAFGKEDALVRILELLTTSMQPIGSAVSDKTGIDLGVPNQMK